MEGSEVGNERDLFVDVMYMIAKRRGSEAVVVYIIKYMLA